MPVWGQEEYRKISVPSSQFFHEPKTALKNRILFCFVFLQRRDTSLFSAHSPSAMAPSSLTHLVHFLAISFASCYLWLLISFSKITQC